MFLEGLFFAGLGLIVGSFLNVCILRYGTGKTVGGRSACPSCNHTLSSRDLIPVLSWLLFFGKCRYCGSAISPQYPIVEALTGLIFLCVGLAPLSILEQVLALVLLSLLIAISVYDIRHTIIPDPWVYAAGVCAFVLGLVLHGTGAFLFVCVGGLLSALPLFVLWLVSSGRWMGFGDIKLALPLGFVLGPLLGFIATFFAFVIGAVVGLALIGIASPAFARLLSFVTPTRRARITQSRFTMKSEVPFGPFLTASFLFLWLTHLYAIPLPLLGY